jgi:hypothetical protein
VQNDNITLTWYIVDYLDGNALPFNRPEVDTLASTYHFNHTGGILHKPEMLIRHRMNDTDLGDDTCDISIPETFPLECRLPFSKIILMKNFIMISSKTRVLNEVFLRLVSMNTTPPVSCLSVPFVFPSETYEIEMGKLKVLYTYFTLLKAHKNECVHVVINSIG